MAQETYKQRTIKQNDALHLWCRELSRECLHRGTPYHVVVEKIHVQWTEDAVKSLVKAVALAMYQTDKTSELTTVQLTEVCKEVDKVFLEEGIIVNFPSFEEKEFIKHYSKY